MKIRYFIVDIFAEGDISMSSSGKLNLSEKFQLPKKAMTHDELVEVYMEPFIDNILCEDIMEMSDEELEDEISIWENELDESIKIYQLDMETFGICNYQIPISKLVKYVRSKCLNLNLKR